MSPGPHHNSQPDGPTGTSDRSLPGARRSRFFGLTLILLGFAAGTVFAGAVGKSHGWNMFGPNAPDETSALRNDASAKPSDRVSDLPSPATSNAVAENCTTLVLNRSAGLTYPDRCPEDTSALAYSSSSGRGDLLKPIE